MTGGISPDHLVNTPQIAPGVTLLICLSRDSAIVLYPGSYPLESPTGAESTQAVKSTVQQPGRSSDGPRRG
jgi:hypothetical protein